MEKSASGLKKTFSEKYDMLALATYGHINGIVKGQSAFILAWTRFCMNKGKKRNAKYAILCAKVGPIGKKDIESTN